jgi:hypothetical protein
MTSALLKHSLSGAADGLIDWEIDFEKKAIEVKSLTAAARNPFVSSANMEHLAHILERDGIIIWHDDDVASWTPLRTPWKVFVTVGDIRLRMVCWHHRKNAHDCEQPLTFELYPVNEESAS